MGKKDMICKSYLSKNDVFADAVNFYFHGGKQVVRPENLTERDPGEMGLLYGKDVLKSREDGDRERQKTEQIPRGRRKKRAELISVQRYRDVLKQCVIRRQGRTVYVIYGIEAQSEIHYAMPVKTMLYDALNYAAQVSEIAEEHVKDGSWGRNSGEFLSGFRREDRLWPVRTLVLYLGAAAWDGPRTLREMMCLPEEEDIFAFNDYRLNLLVPAEIEDFSRFHTQLGSVLEVLKVMEDREKMEELMREKNDVYARLPRDAAELLRVFAKIDMQIEEDEEEVNMCRAIDEMMAEAREEGREDGIRKGEEIGREEGRESLMLNMMRNLFRSGVSFEVASSYVSEKDFPEERLRRIWEKAGSQKLG